MKIKTIIIEDELAAQITLQTYLSQYCPQVELLGIASNAKEGIAMLEAVQPQLVFLDVELPFGNAFDILDATKHLSFKTIFVTAFSEYAIQALNVSAAYYLLKPINIQELILAVNKVHEELEKAWHFDVNAVVMHNLQQAADKQQLVLPTLEGFDVISIASVMRLKGNGNFTNVYTQDGKQYMVCRFLKHFEELLPTHFIRIHKSHIVNKHFITSYQKGSGGTIMMSDGTEVEVSTTYKDNLLSKFK